MANQASQTELNKFVKIVDEFKAKFAKLTLPQTRAQVYASGNTKMISDYETAVSRGNALNSTINAMVGAWSAFKRGYKKVTDTTSTVIGDAVDEIRSWFGYEPAGGIGGLNGLGAIQLAALPAAVAVAGVISAALILNSLMDKIFVSIEANRIQKDNPNISRGAALKQAEAGLPSLLPGGISLPMIAAGALAIYFLMGSKK